MLLRRLLAVSDRPGLVETEAAGDGRAGPAYEQSENDSEQYLRGEVSPDIYS